MIDNNVVVSILRKVKDPQTGLDLIAAKRVKDLKITESQIFFSLAVHDLPQEAKFSINSECYALIKDAYKDAEVHIHFANAGGDDSVLPQVKNVIAVASGKGGVGKSMVSANLAITLQKKGYKVGLMDADLYGPSIPTMFQLEGQRPTITEVYGKPKLIPLEQYGVHIVSIGFIVDAEQAVILRGPRLSGVIKQFVNECIWPELDFLIVDLPPGTGDIQLTLVQSIPVTGAVIVTTPQRVAVADAVKATNMLRLDSINVPILGFVENMAWFTPEELPDNKYFIFGQGGAELLAAKYNTAVLGQVPIIQKIRECSDQGSPATLDPSSSVAMYFNEIADNFENQLRKRHDDFGPTKIVQVSK